MVKNSKKTSERHVLLLQVVGNVELRLPCRSHLATEIAYGEVGALDYIKNGKNGLLFKKQTTKSLVEAINEFEKTKFDSKIVRESSKNFSEARFQKKITEFVKKCQKG